MIKSLALVKTWKRRLFLEVANNRKLGLANPIRLLLGLVFIFCIKNLGVLAQLERQGFSGSKV
jgi:hypothetical protein